MRLGIFSLSGRYRPSPSCDINGAGAKDAKKGSVLECGYSVEDGIGAWAERDEAKGCGSGERKPFVSSAMRNSP